MSCLRIAIMTRSHPDKQVANESGEVEIRADQLVENGRLVLRNLLDQLRMELDELDYQERTEEEDASECPGHESLTGPIGETVYCDGSCRL